MLQSEHSNRCDIHIRERSRLEGYNDTQYLDKWRSKVEEIADMLRRDMMPSR